ncbi:MAG TPA: hypothetical protein VK890_05880, partial [Bacteroidia bacterium]|nr:hypothetical protein [Bacteroidia bacterium]
MNRRYTFPGNSSIIPGFIKKIAIACAFIGMLPVISMAQDADRIHTNSKNAKAPFFAKNSNGKQGVDEQKNPLKKKWSANPFDHKIFVENKGQFD